MDNRKIKALFNNCLTRNFIFAVAFSCSFFALEKAYSQQAMYSLQRLNPMLLNPANTASEGKYRGVLQYRNQQSNDFSPYNRTSASGEMSLDSRSNMKFGLGAALIIDKSSPLGYRSSNFRVNGASHFKLNEKSSFHTGASMGFYNQDLNITNTNREVLAENGYLKINHPENLKFDQSSALAFGLGFGYRWSKPVAKRRWKVNWQLETGVSAQNMGLIELKESEGSQPISEALYTGYATGQIPIDKYFALIPSGFANVSTEITQYILGIEGRVILNSGDQFNSKAKRVMLDVGILQREGDALVLTSNITWGELSLGISYEMPTREPVESLETTGAFEMVLLYSLSGLNF